MEIKYNKKKRVDIKGWLLGGNSKIYMIILILFVTLTLVVLSSLNKISLNSGSSSQDESVFAIENETTESDDEPYIEESQSYKIRINKSTFVLTVYRLLRDDNYVPAYTFRCAINTDVEVGETSIQGKQIWMRNSDWSYGHYACLLGNGAYISSAPYWNQDKNNLYVKAYNKIGSEITIGSIYMKAADAKWIYENCGINIPVEIYELSGEEPEIDLEEFVPLTGSAYYDPSDK